MISRLDLPWMSPAPLRWVVLAWAVVVPGALQLAAPWNPWSSTDKPTTGGPRRMMVNVRWIITFYEVILLLWYYYPGEWNVDIYYGRTIQVSKISWYLPRLYVYSSYRFIFWDISFYKLLFVQKRNLCFVGKLWLRIRAHLPAVPITRPSTGMLS